MSTHLEAVCKGFAFHRKCNRHAFVAYEQMQVDRLIEEFQNSIADSRQLNETKTCELFSVGVIVWWGVASTAGSVRPEVTGYRVESDAETVVEYDLHRPEGTAVLCRVSALDGGKGRVGTVEDAVPAAGPSSVHREVRVRTSTRAVTGVVDSCVRVTAPAP